MHSWAHTVKGNTHSFVIFVCKYTTFSANSSTFSHKFIILLSTFLIFDNFVAYLCEQSLIFAHSLRFLSKHSRKARIYQQKRNKNKKI